MTVSAAIQRQQAAQGQQVCNGGATERAGERKGSRDSRPFTERLRMRYAIPLQRLLQDKTDGRPHTNLAFGSEERNTVAILKGRGRGETGTDEDRTGQDTRMHPAADHQAETSAFCLSDPMMIATMFNRENGKVWNVRMGSERHDRGRGPSRGRGRVPTTNKVVVFGASQSNYDYCKPT